MEDDICTLPTSCCPKMNHPGDADKVTPHWMSEHGSGGEKTMIIGPPFSRELLENWAAGRWCDGYAVTDIAALSSMLLYEMEMRKKLENALAQSSSRLREARQTMQALTEDLGRLFARLSRIAVLE